MLNKKQIIACCTSILFICQGLSADYASATAAESTEVNNTVSNIYYGDEAGKIPDYSLPDNSSTEGGYDDPFDSQFPGFKRPGFFFEPETLLVLVIDLREFSQKAQGALPQQPAFSASTEFDVEAPDDQQNNDPVDTSAEPAFVVCGLVQSRSRASVAPSPPPQESVAVTVHSGAMTLVYLHLQHQGGDGNEPPESAQHTLRPTGFCPACGHFVCELSQTPLIMMLRQMSAMSPIQLQTALTKVARQASNRVLSREWAALTMVARAANNLPTPQALSVVNRVSSIRLLPPAGGCLRQQFQFPHGAIGAICAMPGNRFLVMNDTPPFFSNTFYPPVTPDRFVIYLSGGRCSPEGLHISDRYSEIEQPVVSESLLTNTIQDSHTVSLEQWHLADDHQLLIDQVIRHDRGLGVASLAELPDGRIAGLC